MERLKRVVEAVKIFFDEVIGEMKKSSWPERQELFESTVVVIFSLLLLSTFVGVSDKILVTLFTWLLKMSSGG
ncbi:MAG: preprotein translocase subunit SecE [Kiritimatiellae bacterium]|nr:preprotein translocase subunit SecE [Kiritimatiellia bacterium]MDD5522216.1 preprotein translocase subunit SecE [Kiritimatiellia bacterium]